MQKQNSKKRSEVCIGGVGKCVSRQNVEGVITTYANIRHADHIHELITA